MKSLLLRKSLIILVFLLTANISYWFSWEIDLETETTHEITIKELKENIDSLSEDKTKLIIENGKLNKDNKLRNFLRKNLTKGEIKEIILIINEYKKNRSIYEEKLLIKAKNLEDTTEEKNQLLYLKKEFYKKLTSYIESIEIGNYLEYIKWDAKLLKENKDLTEKLITNKEILSQKVSKIEEQIKENRKNIESSFKFLIKIKIKEKIEKLKNKENYKSLSLELKKQIIEKTINKIKEKILKLEENLDKPETLIKKLEIYKILLTSFEEYILKIE